MGDTCSLKPLGTRVCQAWPPTCTSTNEATSSTSKVMVPSKRVCHTKFTTVPNTPLVSSSTNESEVISSPRGSTSESNTSSTQISIGFLEPSSRERSRQE